LKKIKPQRTGGSFKKKPQRAQRTCKVLSGSGFLCVLCVKLRVLCGFFFGGLSEAVFSAAASGVFTAHFSFSILDALKLSPILGPFLGL
jgi:hypothetical protein